MNIAEPIMQKGATLGRIGLALVRHPEELRRIPTWVESIQHRNETLSSDEPWWPYEVIQLLEDQLDGTQSVFEFGSGSSTLWLAPRVKTLTSVEHDAGWFDGVQKKITLTNANCQLLFRPPAEDDPESASRDAFRSSSMPGDFTIYVSSVDEVPDETLDLAIIDGRCREACLLRSIPKIRPKGMILLDDSERQRYRRAMAELDSWPVEHFEGLRPMVWRPRRTTIWTRPPA